MRCNNVCEDIKNIGQLIDVIRKQKKEYPGAIWYRGHSKLSWELLPSLFRKKNKLSETSLLIRFKQSAAMLTSKNFNNIFDWIFLMQHYGVPTRLLDWSESPLTALYFAVAPHKETEKEDAAFWILKPNKLNLNACINDTDESDYIPSFDAEELKNYEIKSLRATRSELYPIATIATRNNPRIQAQMGTFTIHHRLEIPIEKVGDGEHVKKYKIFAENKGPLYNELCILGINEFSLFPEMESIGNLLKEML